MRVDEFTFNGHKAIVIVPDNPNGKWVWKTEFFYAFDKAEQTLLERGYTRVYYGVSDMYGSPKSVRKMHAFHKFIIEKYALQTKATLFGFSRGGLYAFAYTLFYPEWVDKVYLDAPVLDLKSWPPKGSVEQGQVFDEFSLNEETLQTYNANPVDLLEEFFALHIPVLLVAGDADEVVPLDENGNKMIQYALQAKADFCYIIKSGCKHHPHSLDDVGEIVRFVERAER